MKNLHDKMFVKKCSLSEYQIERSEKNLKSRSDRKIYEKHLSFRKYVTFYKRGVNFKYEKSKMSNLNGQKRARAWSMDLPVWSPTRAVIGIPCDIFVMYTTDAHPWWIGARIKVVEMAKKARANLVGWKKPPAAARCTYAYNV